MQQDFLFLVLMSAVIGILFLGLLAAFLLKKPKVAKEAKNFPRAQEILEALKQKDKSLEDLKKCVNLAKIYYNAYMEEILDFDVQFVLLLATHRAVNAKLLLEIESYFKSANPSRKEIVDKALEVGVTNRK
ncbi:hypothetical protein [Helicobacter colisuis]|uniref:Periplasmic protein n=1 Tax=Helicobacter colisuis TaxID=2949739 RepID=A0ABT0TT50_9HELI|nr:hypothetical protein [Helicobacter colisuis]MCL9818865.1 hypothetical protein [Helicobacter colisuis]